LIGKVGSGKSSLLKTMYAELPLKGDATVLDYSLPKIKNKEIPYLRRKIGIIFQDFQLLTDRSIYDNLQFVLKATGWKNKEDMKKRINEVLKEVGMGAKGYKMPHELSGGEQQRIVIARALLNKPKLILADEPTGNLDPETGKGLVDLLHNICKNEDTTIIMATHNLNLLETHPGNVWSVENHCLISQLAQTSVNSTANCSSTVAAE
jgi:cell division transport system ATP-binding protein